MQTLGSHPRPAGSEALGWGPAICAFTSPPETWSMLKLDNRWSKVVILQGYLYHTLIRPVPPTLRGFAGTVLVLSFLAWTFNELLGCRESPFQLEDTWPCAAGHSQIWVWTPDSNYLWQQGPGYPGGMEPINKSDNILGLAFNLLLSQSFPDKLKAPTSPGFQFSSLFALANSWQWSGPAE